MWSYKIFHLSFSKATKILTIKEFIISKIPEPTIAKKQNAMPIPIPCLFTSHLLETEIQKRIVTVPDQKSQRQPEQ